MNRSAVIRVHGEQAVGLTSEKGSVLYVGHHASASAAACSGRSFEFYFKSFLDRFQSLKNVFVANVFF